MGPLITFWQTRVDAMNAMVTVPGEFGSFGHDYRADRIKASHLDTAPPAPAQRKDGEREVGGVPLRVRRTGGARWLRSLLRRPGEAPGDIQ